MPLKRVELFGIINGMVEVLNTHIVHCAYGCCHGFKPPTAGGNNSLMA